MGTPLWKGLRSFRWPGLFSFVLTSIAHYVMKGTTSTRRASMGYLRRKYGFVDFVSSAEFLSGNVTGTILTVFAAWVWSFFL